MKVGEASRRMHGCARMLTVLEVYGLAQSLRITELVPVYIYTYACVCKYVMHMFRWELSNLKRHPFWFSRNGQVCFFGILIFIALLNLRRNPLRCQMRALCKYPMRLQTSMHIHTCVKRSTKVTHLMLAKIKEVDHLGASLPSSFGGKDVGRQRSIVQRCNDASDLNVFASAPPLVLA